MKKTFTFTFIAIFITLGVVAQQRHNYNFERFTQKKPAVFSGEKFDSIMCFYETEFHDMAWFDTAKFHSPALFIMATFESYANFHLAEFDSTIDFSYSKFDSVLDFQGAKFKWESVFIDTQLPLYLNLSEVKTINKEIDFTKSDINPKHEVCEINLVNSNIDKIKFLYSRFELYFPDGTKPEIKANVYEKLLTKQRKEGFVTSIEKLEKEYKEFRYLESGEYGKMEGYILNLFNKNWWGYGYDKDLILWNTIILFLIFCLVNSWYLHELNQLVYTVEIIPNDNFKDRFLRLYYTIIYTGLIFFGLKFTLNNLHLNYTSRKRVLGLIWFFVNYVVGIICLAYLANYIIIG